MPAVHGGSNFQGANQWYLIQNRLHKKKRETSNAAKRWRFSCWHQGKLPMSWCQCYTSPRRLYKTAMVHDTLRYYSVRMEVPCQNRLLYTGLFKPSLSSRQGALRKPSLIYCPFHRLLSYGGGEYSVYDPMPPNVGVYVQIGIGEHICISTYMHT